MISRHCAVAEWKEL